MHPSILVPPTLFLLSGCLVDPAGGKARIAYSRHALVVAEQGDCRVELTRLSYDDPGSDDSEFIELRVRGAPNAAPVDPPPTDGGIHVAVPPCEEAGPPPAPVPPDPPVVAGPTLGQCGLERLELVNGGSTCAVYREIPFSDVPIPADGFVLVCSEDATLEGCDVTHAGTRKLPNGWMQNGPDDGLRFVAKSGVSAVFSYEASAGGCFGDDALSIAAESGEVESAAGPSDDVNVACNQSFVLVPAAETMLGTPPSCPAAPPDNAPQADGRAPVSSLEIDAASAAVEPPKAAGTATQSVRVDEAPPELLPPEADAGVGDASVESARFPNVPGGCRMPAEPRPASLSSAPWAFLAAAALSQRRRWRRALCGKAPGGRSGYLS